jgi:hypothetical protein
MAQQTHRTIVMVARTHPDDFERFTDLEDRFAELFADHGLVLRHRFRDAHACSEVHVIDALDPDSVSGYFADPRRVALQGEFEALRIDQTVLDVDDIADEST